MKTNKTNPTKDPIINSIINQLAQRSAAGQKKYGVGLDRQDLTTGQWLQHAQDEALDLAGYLEVLKTRTAEAEPSTFQQAVTLELAAARKKHENIPSVFCGFSIIFGCVTKLSDEFRKYEGAYEDLPKDNQAIYRRLVQLAAMAQRLTEDLLDKKANP